MLRTMIVGGLAVLGGMAATGVSAADMPGLFPQQDYADVDPAPRYEFGTGWYLRGDLTGSNDVEPTVLGTLPTRSADHRDWGYGAGIGAGYKFTDWFRADVTADYLSTQKQGSTDVQTGIVAKANLHRFDGLVNGYFDLGNWYGFTPYIGGGVGFAGLRTDGSVTFPNVGRLKVKGETEYNLAWAAMAGVSYSIAPHLLLDVGYRYLDLGRYQPPTSFAYTTKKTDMDAHEVRVGLRYQID